MRAGCGDALRLADDAQQTKASPRDTGDKPEEQYPAEETPWIGAWSDDLLNEASTFSRSHTAPIAPAPGAIQDDEPRGDEACGGSADPYG